MAVLLNSLLDTAFVTEPAEALKTYISDNYIIGTPAKADTKFDTKFGNLSERNIIIIENIANSTKRMTLGIQRYAYNETKRVQIFCRGSTAKNNKYLIEQHIEDIINANSLGMQSYGIISVIIESFQDISTEADGDISKGKPRKETIFRSSALVRMYYEKYVS